MNTDQNDTEDDITNTDNDAGYDSPARGGPDRAAPPLGGDHLEHAQGRQVPQDPDTEHGAGNPGVEVKKCHTSESFQILIFKMVLTPGFWLSAHNECTKILSNGQFSGSFL